MGLLYSPLPYGAWPLWRSRRRLAVRSAGHYMGRRSWPTRHSHHRRRSHPLGRLADQEVKFFVQTNESWGQSTEVNPKVWTVKQSKL